MISGFGDGSTDLGVADATVGHGRCWTRAGIERGRAMGYDTVTDVAGVDCGGRHGGREGDGYVAQNLSLQILHGRPHVLHHFRLLVLRSVIVRLLLLPVALSLFPRPVFPLLPSHMISSCSNKKRRWRRVITIISDDISATSGATSIARLICSRSAPVYQNVNHHYHCHHPHRYLIALEFDLFCVVGVISIVNSSTVEGANSFMCFFLTDVGNLIR